MLSEFMLSTNCPSACDVIQTTADKLTTPNAFRKLCSKGDDLLIFSHSLVNRKDEEGGGKHKKEQLIGKGLCGFHKFNKYRKK